MANDDHRADRTAISARAVADVAVVVNTVTSVMLNATLVSPGR